MPLTTLSTGKPISEPEMRSIDMNSTLYSVSGRGLRLSKTAASSLAILMTAWLILINILLHSHVYGNRNYRQDEIFVTRLFSIYSMSALVLDTADDPGPPGWRLLADFWADSFGLSEEVTRWLSKLTNLLTFALIFQLGKQIRDRRVGIYALVILGVYGFASNSMFELRPYSMLVMLVTALHLLFFRWIHQPSSKLMFGYVFVGIAAIYTHFFSFFVFPAHAFCLILLTRYCRRLWANTFLMWAFIALSFLGWLLPFLQTISVVMPGGIYYGIPRNWAGIRYFYNESKFLPEIIYQFLMLLSPFAPLIGCRAGAIESRFRFRYRVILLYPLLLLISMIAIAYAADSVVRSFTLRNVVMFAPTIALCMALGLRLFSTKVALVVASFLILHAPTNIASKTTNGPYREIVHEMARSYQSDSILITEFDWAWHWLLPAAYYLMDFTPDNMSKFRMYHFVEPRDNAHPPNYPDELVNIHKWFNSSRFENQLPIHSQLWHLQEGGGNDLGTMVANWLNQHYAHVRTVNWNDGFATSFSLSEYVRAPSNQGPMLEVGDNLRLYAWQRYESTDSAPCQAVMIESWWQLGAADSTPYTLSLILADNDGDGQLAISNSLPADTFTSQWEPDKFYRDRTSLIIPCDIAHGQYNLLLAAKESNSGEPLRLADPGGEEIGSEYYLTTLSVGNG